MKLFKKSLIILGTLVTLIMLFTLFAVNTAALSPNYDGSEYTIYYFNDYYPSADEETLSNAFPTYNIVYDHQWLDSQMFDNMLSYFYGLDDNCVFILDIKTFTPNASSLDALFSGLKAQSECTIIFVSATNLGAFSNLNFMNYVDGFYESDFSRLKAFVDKVLDEIFNENEPFANKTILIDGRLVDSNAFYSSNTSLSLGTSVFMNILLDKLAEIISVRFNGLNLTTDNDVITFLNLDSINVNIIIHVGENEYYDVAAQESFESDSISGLDASGGFTYEYLYAISIYPLDQDLYDSLLNDNDLITAIYLLLGESIVYGEGGLSSCVTDIDLGVECDETDILLSLLLELLGAE